MNKSQMTLYDRQNASTVLTEHTNLRMAEILENEGFPEFVEMLINKTVEYVVMSISYCLIFNCIAEN